MKILILILFLLIIEKNVEAQTNWVNKEIGNGLHVEFPVEPTYKTQDKAGTYVAKTLNCLFMVLVTYNVTPHYSDFLKLSPSNQIKLNNILLDGIIKGKLQYINNTNIPSSSIQIGQYFGREISYSALNPATGIRGERFSKVFLIYNKTYSFECWYLTSSEQCESEKNLFLNPITLN